MRFHVAPATVEDVGFMAAVMSNGDENQPGGDTSADDVSRLLAVYNRSTEVWAARDRSDETCVLWGVTPDPHDDKVGHLWMLATGIMDSEVLELAALTKLVVTQMLGRFAQLENDIDVTKERAMALLRHVGFHIDPARDDVVSGQSSCRAWIDATDPSVSFGQPSRSMPN